MLPGPLRRAGARPPVFALGLAALLAPAVARADKAEAVGKLLEGGKPDQARERCEKWAAQAPDAEEALREACARAYWEQAKATDTVAGWRSFRSAWEQSTLGPRARAAEAAAALREAGPQEREPNLLILADRYAGTPSEALLRERAAAAAVRDARDGDEAKAVARRYPKAAELPELVARFPAAFVQVRVKGRAVSVTVDPPVPLSGAQAPLVRWVARAPSGATTPWDEHMRAALVAWGTPDGLATGGATPAEGPRFPLCAVPGAAPGTAPAVEVEVAGGVLTVPVGFDEGCGEAAWPGFLVLNGGQASALSLRPNHLVELSPPPVAPGGRTVRAFLPPPGGEPELADGLVWQRTPAAWLVTPVAGGAPWATGAAPGRPGLPLGGALRGAPLPSDWTLSGEEGRMVARSAALARMPPAMQRWALPAGDVRVLPVHLRGTFGLLAQDAQPRRPVAPALDAGGGWVRNADGSLQRTQPLGADVAGIAPLDEVGVETALGILAGLGVKRGRVQPIDGWRVDVDNDRVPEAVIRATIDQVGVVLIVDPIEGTEAATVETARVFLFEEPVTRAGGMRLDLPFAFRKGDFVYMAWGAERGGPGPGAERHIIAVRADGQSFVVDRFALR